MIYGESVAGVQENEWMGCPLNDLGYYGIQTNKWTNVAQDEGEWHKRASQGADSYMTKWMRQIELGLHYGLQ